MKESMEALERHHMIRKILSYTTSVIIRVLLRLNYEGLFMNHEKKMDLVFNHKEIIRVLKVISNNSCTLPDLPA